jgi:hypothetical protein
VISYRAYHRKVVRKARCDQIRREIREQIDLLDRCEAGDPEAIRQVEENHRALAESYEVSGADYPEPRPRRPRRRRRYFARLRSCFARPRRYFVGAEDDDEFDLADEPDLPPSWLPQPGESDRRYRHRPRPDLNERRAAALLARGYWRVDRPLPGAVREALFAVCMGPRELRRTLLAIWERGGPARRGDCRVCGPAELAPGWTLHPRELPLGWPGDDGPGLEVCPLRGPPAVGRSGSLVGLAHVVMTGGP